jgi:hypothetical integral membrane protein (TIGR02206 family)
MERYFAINYPGAPFQLFGPGHLLVLAIAATLGTLLIRAGLRADADGRRNLRRLLASLLLINEIGRHAWALLQGVWKIQTDLPFQLCAAMVWITAFALFFNARRLFPMLYFFGIAGALQGVLTPDAGAYGLPHYFGLEVLFSHSSIVIGGIWVAVVESYRPQFRHFWAIFGGLNVAALIMYFVNSAIGSNYLFVNSKPATASIIDLLPAWPWYILYLEVIAFVLFFSLYLPFGLRGRRPAAEQKIG